MSLFFAKKDLIKQYISKGAVILDVRNPGEFSGANIPGSINIPLGDLGSKKESLDKSTPIIACCAAGIRSEFAKKSLIKDGFDVINGGGWKNLQSKL